jgi:hypothetical protein
MQYAGPEAHSCKEGKQIFSEGKEKIRKKSPSVPE